MEFLLTNLFGAVLGLIVGLTYNKFETRFTKSSRQRIAKAQLAKAFRFNLDRIVQMLDQTSGCPPKEIPNHPFDTHPVMQAMFYGRDLLGTPEDLASYNWHRYQLDHLNVKLIYILNHPASRTETVPDFRDHLAGEQTAITDILSKLEAAKSQ